MKKVLIITGGISSERSVSLISAKEVKKGLEESGFSVSIFDLKKGLPKLKEAIKKCDVCFPVLHGEEGEGGDLQNFLESSKIPFVGGDPKGFKQGWHKISFKKFCDKHNIKTAEWKQVSTAEDITNFGFPAVIKNSSGGSSKEVMILQTKADLKSAQCQKLIATGHLFVERFIKGVEVTVGILGDQAMPVIEIIPPENSWFNFQNKYSGVSKEIPFAPSVSKKIQTKVQKTALKIHQILNLGHLSRIDFIVVGSDHYVLEVNTIPGMTSESLFPKAALATHITFPKLVKKLVEMATMQNHSA